MVEFDLFGILADDRPIRLGGRAFGVLMALIEASGAVVSKDELLRLTRSDFESAIKDTLRHYT